MIRACKNEAGWFIEAVKDPGTSDEQAAKDKETLTEFKAFFEDLGCETGERCYGDAFIVKKKED